MQRNLLAVVLAISLAGCATTTIAPQRSALAQWSPSPNFNARRAELIVLHHTGLPDVDTARRVLSEGGSSRVSAHYLIAADGRIIQLVDDGARAWHAGQSHWGSITDVNSASIGIELDNDGTKPFAPAQINALLSLLGDLTTRLGIPKEAVVGHGDIAPGRKDDPNRYFPWALLAQRGFGLWYDTPLIPAPPNFDTIAALALIGYDVSRPRAAIVAFHRHYRGIETDVFDDADAPILYALQRKLTATR